MKASRSNCGAISKGSRVERPHLGVAGGKPANRDLQTTPRNASVGIRAVFTLMVGYLAGSRSRRVRVTPNAADSLTIQSESSHLLRRA
jgi:hypothetical protein